MVDNVTDRINKFQADDQCWYGVILPVILKLQNQHIHRMPQINQDVILL